MKQSGTIMIALVLAISVSGQRNDSAAVASTFNDLLRSCNKIDFNDPKTSSVGLFYKAAAHIVYMGSDKTRKWKSPANYSNAEEKLQVNEICIKINSKINIDSGYRVAGYRTETESEGKWHVLIVEYTKNGKIKHSSFAFLKVKEKYLLGDID